MFRRIVHLSVGLGVLVAAAGSVLGQWEEVPADKFNTANRNSDELRKNVPYRVRSGSGRLPEKGPGNVISSVAEYVGPDRAHYLTRYISMGKVHTVEVIMIGTRRFMRTDDEPWVRADKDFGPQLVAPEPEKKTHFFRTEFGADGRRLDVFKVVEETKHALDWRKIYIYRTHTWTFWFDQNGRLVKTTGQLDEGPVFTMITEYDPNIKIEVPIP